MTRYPKAKICIKIFSLFINRVNESVQANRIFKKLMIATCNAGMQQTAVITPASEYGLPGGTLETNIHCGSN